MKHISHITGSISETPMSILTLNNEFGQLLFVDVIEGVESGEGGKDPPGVTDIR